MTQGLKSLVTEPLTRFDRLAGNDDYVLQHSKKEYHQLSVAKSENFLERLKKDYKGVTFNR